jgi:ABC-2 type transport system ATP-binding protein
MALLATQHLTKDYGSFRALDDLNLVLEAGEVFGLLGPNGSGKSTTLRLLLGFLQPTAGNATIGGHDCWNDSVAARRLTAYLPGELRLYENMSGWQLLRFLAGLRGTPLGPEAEPLARRFDIDLDRPIASLSSGMKRKLALMQVLLPSVPLLILDEPTNTLDPTMRDELLDQLVKAKKRGQTVLFSSHVLQEVERVCDRVAILSRGKLVHLQSMAELQSARLARVRFARSALIERGLRETANLPGVRVAQQTNGELCLECTGDLQPLLQWLATQAVDDLRIEPVGLGPIYHRYHANLT